MKRCIFVGLLIGCAVAAQAEDRLWNAASGDWNDAANWLDGVKPAAWETALVDNGGVCELASGTVGVGSLIVGATSSDLSTFRQTGGSLSVMVGGVSPFGIGGRDNHASKGRYELAGGSLSVSSYSQIGTHGEGEMVMSGGTFTANDWTAVGRFTGGRGVLRVEGGTFTQVKNGVIVGEDGTGLLVVTNTGVFNVQNGIFAISRNDLPDNSTHGTVRLETGGTLRVPAVEGRMPGDFVFAGGLLQVSGAGRAVDPFFAPTVSVAVEAGGAVVDTHGNDIRIDSALQAPAEGASGGLVKTGGGTLRLAGANTYAGRTVVSNGVLVAESAAALPGYDRPGQVEVCADAVLVLGDAWTDAERAALRANAALPDDAGRIVWGTGTLAGAFGDELDATKYLYLVGGHFAGKDGAITARNGTAPGEIAFARGAVAGFTATDAPLTVRMGGDALQTLVWGSDAFAPDTLLLNAPTAQAPLAFENPVDLDGQTVAVRVDAGTATLSGAVSDTAGGSVLTKTGPGMLKVTAQARNVFGRFASAEGATVFDGGENALSDVLVHSAGSLLLTNTAVSAARVEFAGDAAEVRGGSLTAQNEIALGWWSDATAQTVDIRDAAVQAKTLRLGYWEQQSCSLTAKDATFALGRIDVCYGTARFENCTITGLAGTGLGHWMLGSNTRGSRVGSSLVLDGGSLTSGNAACDFQVGACASPAGDAMTLTGGATASVMGWPSVGRYNGATGTLEVADGAFTQADAGRYLIVGEDGHGTLKVGGAGAVTARGLLVGGTAMNGNVNSWGDVEVAPGGVLNVGWINGGSLPGANHRALRVDGGTIRAAYPTTAAHPTFIGGLTEFTVGGKGVTFDTAGRSVEIASPLRGTVSARLPATNVVHRWSFNGDFADSVGGATATGLDGYSFKDGKQVSLPGGKKAGAVDLGANMLPADSDGVTIEVWATQRGVQAWSRVLDFCSNANDALLMAWTAGMSLNDDDVCIKKSGNGDMRAKLAPYTLNTEFHIALTLKRRADGKWDGAVYKQDAQTGATLRKHAFTTTTDWSPATQGQAHCYIGRSFNPDADADACADYNEVRIWNTALSEAELTASAQLGPDSDLMGPLVRKTGAGTLALSAAGSDWAGSLAVEAGTLVAGSSALTHRWSFNGDYADSVGGKTATPSGNVVFENDAVKLPGGNWGAGFVDLGADVFPKTGAGVTLELWARQDQIYSWSRVFEFGSSPTDSILMAWTAGTDINSDDTCIKKSNGGHDWREQLYPFSLGTWWHVALTFSKRADGLWDVAVYKQDAATGATAKKFAFTTTAGWSPLTQNLAYACLGHSLNSNDKDAAASYDEVRIWNAALTEAQLTASAVAGPDALPELELAGFGTSLPAGCSVSVAAGATLDLAGSEASVGTVDLAGALVNGTLAVADGIYPGGKGVIGTLALDGRTHLRGRLVVDADATGACDRIVCASGALDLAGLRLELADASALKPGSRYVLATFPAGADNVVGADAFAAAAKIPANWKVRANAASGEVTLSAGGLVLLVR